MKNQKKKSKKRERNKAKEELSSKILRYISYKSRTSYECNTAAAKYLSSYSLNSSEKKELIQEVLTPLKEAGYVDDEDYAKSYILEQKERTLPRGPFYVSKFLKNKGVVQNVIKRSLDKNYTAEEERICIKKLISKKGDKTRDKLVNYLLRRGFSKHLVYDLVDSKGINH